MWHGMQMTNYWRLLAANRFRIHPFRWPMTGAIAGFSILNSALTGLTQGMLGERIKAVKIDPPPLFIIGHWRSGTTYLHELMSLDDRFQSPNMYQCFAPQHCLISEAWIPRIFWFVIPRKRPMDNVAMGWKRPQEDEFALLAMGLPSPYRRMAFPNHPPVDMNYLDMSNLSSQELAQWEQGLTHFCQCLMLRDARQVILKSPTHTGRIALLARLFPGAKFIHLTRHPYSVYPSTVRLWKSLDLVQGFQVPRHRGLEKFVHESFARMYGGFESQRSELAPESICDVKYEDIVDQPEKVLRTLYKDLDLGDFDPVEQKLQQYLKTTSNYQVNEHTLDEETKADIDRHWGDYMQKYGYGEESRA